MTPLQKTYQELQTKYPGALILLRVGDFWEAFGDSARTVADALGLVVTKRAGTPMCGFACWTTTQNGKQLAAAGHEVILAERLPDGRIAETRPHEM